MKPLLQGIWDRFTTDVSAAFYTDVNRRLFMGLAPQKTPYPFGEFHIITDNADWQFNEDFEDVLVQFNLFSTSATEVYNMATDLDSMFNKCSLSVSGYRHHYMYREISTPADSGIDGVHQYSVQFRLLLEDT